MNKKILDLFIIGGGINGTAIAADAAGRGLSVTLCEKNDLASGTSSCSSKLIHGGLRYLELYEFSLVKKALREREILMKRAPHLIIPLEFILPHEPHCHPAWMIKIGLFLYDHLAKRQLLPSSKTIDLQTDIHGKELQVHLKKGFSYFDCYTDDARLVILNALSAKEHHATILTRTEFMSAEPYNDVWKIQLKNSTTHDVFYCYTKALVNVSGPWVKESQAKIKGASSLDIQFIKGSHIVIPKLYEGNFAYILQNKDQRIIFAIPFENHYTLIGTTDIAYHDTLENIHISSEEEIYLCNIINDYFKKSITPKDIIWSYAGVRCLQDQHKAPSKITRDYHLQSEYIENVPLLTVISGKLTTHRLLAEKALQKCRDFFPNLKPAWTSKHPLPGGNIVNYNFKTFRAAFKKEFFWLPDDITDRYARDYGTRVYLLLNASKNMSDLGIHFGHGLYQIEVEYLLKEEWAKTCDDIIWRRTKFGLVFSKDEIKTLNQWIIDNSNLTKIE
jgi:glycerol-3-phosphate dehydrogenase